MNNVIAPTARPSTNPTQRAVDAWVDPASMVGAQLIQDGNGNYINPVSGRTYLPAGPNAVMDAVTGQVFSGSNSNNYPAPIANNRSTNNSYAPTGNTWTPPVDNRIPTVTSNGTVLVPSGAGYVNTRDGNYLPQVAPNAVINPSTGQIIPVP